MANQQSLGVPAEMATRWGSWSRRGWDTRARESCGMQAWWQGRGGEGHGLGDGSPHLPARLGAPLAGHPHRAVCRLSLEGKSSLWPQAGAAGHVNGVPDQLGMLRLGWEVFYPGLRGGHLVSMARGTLPSSAPWPVPPTPEGRAVLRLWSLLCGRHQPAHPGPAEKLRSSWARKTPKTRRAPR